MGIENQRLLQRAAALADSDAAKAASILAELLKRNSQNRQALQLSAYLHLKAGRAGEAIKLHRQALVSSPLEPGLWRGLGLAALYAGQGEEAVEAYRKATELQPLHSPSWRGLGDAHSLTGDPVAALDAYERAGKLAPYDAPILLKIAATTNRLLLITREAAALRRLTRIRPKAEAFHALGLSLCHGGRVKDGIAAFRKALVIDPAMHEAQSGIAMGSLMVPGAPRRVFLEHRQWGIVYGQAATGMPPRAVRSTAGTAMRVGYVSGQFKDCSHAFFFEPLLTNHRKDRVSPICYSNVASPDNATTRLRRLAHKWRDIARKSDDEVEALIRKDRIDVLVDLDGHSDGHRLAVFARRPVPTQVTYLGYPATTGLEAIDYRLTDSICDPVGATERFHTEKLLRLDPCFLTYSPPDNAPEPGALPFRATGNITFVCFNGLPKLSPDCLDLFADVLKAVPESRLLLKCIAFHDPASESRIRRFFADRGIAASRVATYGFLAHRVDHLRLYTQADVALDSLPYAGTTTTCEALWMGLPVITLAGQTHVQRVGKTLLQQAGLPELAADSRQDYVAAAVRLASNTGELAEIRAGLRSTLRRSALMQPARFARQFEALLLKSALSK